MAVAKKGLLQKLAEFLFGAPAPKRKKATKKTSRKSTSKKKNKKTTVTSRKRIPAPKRSKMKKPYKAPRVEIGKDANISRQHFNGQTLQTKDRYLPIGKGGVSDNQKEDRRVVIIDSNNRDELAVIRLTTQNQPNTTILPSYQTGNWRTTYFKHFVEIKDNAGNPIKVDGEKFTKNPSSEDMTRAEVEKIRLKVLNHTHQSSANKEKIATLKASGDKGKTD